MKTVRCLLCGETIRLNEDTPATRQDNIDPSQQMRRHILNHALMPEMAKWTRHNMVWLADLLLFDSPEAPEKYSANLKARIEWVQNELPIRKP